MGEVLSLYTTIPFLGLLLSIALCPLFFPQLWHDHFGKISAVWAILTAIPLIMAYPKAAVHELWQVLTLDYVPFIILLWSLFTVSGGIIIRGNLQGTPLANTLILFLGTILASWVGTTGASMLLIRFFLRANSFRKNRSFMVVFFIVLVSNIGGALSPLGDPPLFLGFLHGVPFLWTFNLLSPMLFMIIALLSIYFLLDAFHYKKEQPVPRGIKGSTKKIWVDGLINLIFLAGIIAMVLISGLVNLGPFSFWGIEYQRINLIRDVFLIFMGLMSLWTTPQSIREDNEFTWVPIREVAYIFLGLFITMVPCMLILKAGDKGALSVVTSFIKEPFHYFWACGILSSFLDNAPTYMAFFCSILGQFYPGIPEGVSVPRLLNDHAVFLKAISCGAVFMGANTYIGNAPNFMVRSIAEESGVTMPSFFGYIFNYSLPILCPLFFILGLIFF